LIQTISPRALLLTLLAYGLFSVGNAGVKALGPDFPLAVLLGFRFWLGLLFLAPLALRHFGSVRGWFYTTRLKSHLIRATLGLICVVLCFYAFTRLPFGEATSLFRMTPVFMCALSGMLLAEPTTFRQWIAVMIGFLGVLLIVEPGGIAIANLDPWAVTAILVAALAAAISDLGMRDLAQKHHAMTITGWYFMLAAIATLPFTILQWQMPNLIQLAILIMIAASGILGQLLLATVLKTLTAPIIAPFTHSTFVWGFGLGFLLWGEAPTWLGLAGAGLIAAGCVLSAGGKTS
jgi:drug/metabolite transporter (DMT)-like permease